MYQVEQNRIGVSFESLRILVLEQLMLGTIFGGLFHRIKVCGRFVAALGHIISPKYSEPAISSEFWNSNVLQEQIIDATDDPSHICLAAARTRMALDWLCPTFFLWLRSNSTPFVDCGRYHPCPWIESTPLGVLPSSYMIR